METVLLVFAIGSYILATIIYLNSLCEGKRIDNAFDYPIFTMILHSIGYLIPFVNIMSSGYFYNKMKR